MNVIPRYVRAYGGINSLLSSYYFWISIAITIICSEFFISPNWWDISISIIPDIVGFSIAGVAIFISIGSDELRSKISGRLPGETDESPFISFMAMFTHFVMTQLAALLIAIISKLLYSLRPPDFSFLTNISEAIKPVFWLLGGFTFIYSLLLCMALVLEIFRLSFMIDDYQTRINSLPPQSKPSKKKPRTPA